MRKKPVRRVHGLLTFPKSEVEHPVHEEHRPNRAGLYRSIDLSNISDSSYNHVDQANTGSVTSDTVRGVNSLVINSKACGRASRREPLTR